MDKGAERELRELGLHPPVPFMLDQEPARDMGIKCLDCWSPKVVYFISKPLGKAFEPGGYCYRHLLDRCRRSAMIPYPIELELLNKLKLDLGMRTRTQPTVTFSV